MKQKIKRIGVLMGGPSGEREVSLKSGGAVCTALGSLGYEVVPVDPEKDAKAKGLTFSDLCEKMIELALK